MHEASLYKKGEDKMVTCQGCSWYCKIAEGNTGICGVRVNDNGKLYLMVYGKPVAVNVDPIEKKPLFHFLPGTEVFSIGTIGCNFKCEFCQNWDISQAPNIAKKDSPKPKDYIPVLKNIIQRCPDWPPKKIVEECVKEKIPSVSYTYNEPAVFFEYAYDTAKLGHEKGLKNVYVSNGFESKEALEKIHPYLDAINIDLKSFNPKFYEKTCHAKIEPVKENIKRVHDMGIWLEVTTLLIPGENDSDEELQKIAKFLADISRDIPWHVTAFYPQYNMLDSPPTPPETLLRAYHIGKDAGLKFVYTGKLGMQCTACHIKNGKCEKCGEKIPGVFK
jgi:pyruvate formate lyase activating enzyme